MLASHPVAVLHRTPAPRNLPLTKPRPLLGLFIQSSFLLISCFWASAFLLLPAPLLSGHRRRFLLSLSPQHTPLLLSSPLAAAFPCELILFEFFYLRGALPLVCTEMAPAQGTGRTNLPQAGPGRQRAGLRASVGRSLSSRATSAQVYPRGTGPRACLPKESPRRRPWCLPSEACTLQKGARV